MVEILVMMKNRLLFRRTSLMLTGGKIYPLPLANTQVESPAKSSLKKDKVVFVLGVTGTGKSKLAIDLASRFNGEIVNSDKMQVYDGLSIITNKVTEKEMAGIRHHLIGGVHPDADFTADEFRCEAVRAIESVLERGKLPIVAGGSNSYIEALVDGGGGSFRERYECCFVWVDVELTVLHEFVRERVDKMVERGMVDEARKLYKPNADYYKGVRRSLGVPELARYLHVEAEDHRLDDQTKLQMLEEGIERTKVNTCKLTCVQLQKIHRLCKLPRWLINRIDLTDVFHKRGLPEEEEAWVNIAIEPSVKIVEEFLKHNENFAPTNACEQNNANKLDNDINGVSVSVVLKSSVEAIGSSVAGVDTVEAAA